MNNKKKGLIMRVQYMSDLHLEFTLNQEYIPSDGYQWLFLPYPRR